MGFATIPFGMEGPIRRQLAESQLQLLQKRLDGVVTFANDGLLQIARELPLAKAFSALGAIIARSAAHLSGALARPDVIPLRRTLGRARDWRFGMGSGRDKHRCFVAVDEAYHSPWFTSLPEEISHAIVMMSVPTPAEEAEILNLAVVLAKRRKGEGGALLKAAMDEFQARHVSRVFLEVRESNEGGIAFYERHGFLKTGRRASYYRNPEEAAIVMEKKLTG